MDGNQCVDNSNKSTKSISTATQTDRSDIEKRSQKSTSSDTSQIKSFRIRSAHSKSARTTRKRKTMAAQSLKDTRAQNCTELPMVSSHENKLTGTKQIEKRGHKKFSTNSPLFEFDVNEEAPTELENVVTPLNYYTHRNSKFSYGQNYSDANRLSWNHRQVLLLRFIRKVMTISS